MSKPTENDVHLWIEDMLPTIYEAAFIIFHYSKKRGSALRKTVINQYAEALHDIWVRSFDKQHVGGKTLKPS